MKGIRLQSLVFITAIMLVFLAIGIQQPILVLPSHPEYVGDHDSPEEEAKKHGVTFPIAELGNCENFAACRTYCEDPVNKDTCIDFAKKKGFYKEEKVRVDIRNNEFWTKTRAELGCNSESTCRAFCEQEANYDTCNNFAKKHQLTGGYTENPQKAQILEKAKEMLGCTSYESCMAYCSDGANKDTCSEFAKKAGLRGGEQTVGPGGCTSHETCRKFCSDPENYQICSQYSLAGGTQFSGPGGCNSEGSCRQYCEKNPQECIAIKSSHEGSQYDPIEMCQKTPECTWTDNTCRCGKIGGVEPEEYCKQYPDRCRSYHDPASECSKHQGCSWTGNMCKCSASTGGSFDPGKECSKYPGCSWTGTTCHCSAPPENSQQKMMYPSASYGEPYNYEKPQNTYYRQPEHNPAEMCKKTPGCSWTGSSCQCSNTSTGTTNNAYPSYQQNSGGTSYDPAAECSKHAGCSWTGTTCQCSKTSSEGSQNPPTNSGSTSDPAAMCSQTPGCSWTGSTCQCGNVQGTTTKRNFLQVIWDFLFG